MFAGRDGNRLRGIEKSSVESKDKERLIGFSAREDVEVHESGRYPTLHVRRNDTGVYDIWQEGYQATCEYCSHHMVAHHVRGKDFIDAVERWYNGLPNKDDYGNLRVWTDEKGERHASLWGCELFGNEADAARRFG